MQTSSVFKTGSRIEVVTLDAGTYNDATLLAFDLFGITFAHEGDVRLVPYPALESVRLVEAATR